MNWHTNFLNLHALSEDYLSNVKCLIDWLNRELKFNSRSFCLAINGAQGSGKSTLSAYLKAYLESQSITAEVVSIDDFYLSKAQRAERATQYHPLFKVRGVPGTHNVAFALEQLKRFKAGKDFILPRFNKATDEPYEEANWLHCNNKPKVLIFEGWCIGLTPQKATQLLKPINSLEENLDPSGKYRHQINQFLSNEYQELFSFFDKLVFLDAQSFERVYDWRLQQEHRLIARQGMGMSDLQVKEFIQYFERLTRWGFSSLGASCDLHIKLDKNRQFSFVN